MHGLKGHLNNVVKKRDCVHVFDVFVKDSALF